MNSCEMYWLSIIRSNGLFYNAGLQCSCLTNDITTNLSRTLFSVLIMLAFQNSDPVSRPHVGWSWRDGWGRDMMTSLKPLSKLFLSCQWISTRLQQRSSQTFCSSCSFHVCFWFIGFTYCRKNRLECKKWKKKKKKLLQSQSQHYWHRLEHCFCRWLQKQCNDYLTDNDV